DGVHKYPKRPRFLLPVLNHHLAGVAGWARRPRISLQLKVIQVQGKRQSLGLGPVSKSIIFPLKIKIYPFRTSVDLEKIAGLQHSVGIVQNTDFHSVEKVFGDLFVRLCRQYFADIFLNRSNHQSSTFPLIQRYQLQRSQYHRILGSHLLSAHLHDLQRKGGDQLPTAVSRDELDLRIGVGCGADQQVTDLEILAFFEAEILSVALIQDGKFEKRLVPGSKSFPRALDVFFRFEVKSPFTKRHGIDVWLKNLRD